MKNIFPGAALKASLLLIPLTAYALLALFGCKDSSTAPGNTDYIITQSDLDHAALFLRDSGITGDTPDKLFDTIHVVDNLTTGWHYLHDTMTILHSMRTVYENQIAHNDSAAVGAIYIRKYFSDPELDNHYQTTLKKIMLMVKRNRGFFPDGGDWEYATIDASGITAQHPNGILPTMNPDSDSLSMTAVRGKLKTRCGDCHEERKGMSDLFF